MEDSPGPVLRARLAELNEEIGTLEVRLRLSTAERERVREGISCLRYPVLTIPPEIIEHIFSFYVCNPHIGHTNTPGRGPLVLASVCRQWRNICLSDGSLWASLRVYTRGIRYERLDPLLASLRCWLSRAGRRPLDLHLHGSKYIAWILSCISQDLEHCKSLRLTLNPRFLLPNAALCIPSLQKLTINVQDDEEEEWTMVNVFSEAPSLREVDISVYTRWISLPWIQLTHLRLSKIVLSECLNILQKTLKLEVLRLSDLDGLGSNPSRPHVILPSLRTLSLSHDPDTIIEHLTLPALQTLGLRSIDIASPTRWVNIGLRSAWPLRSITTWEMAPNARDICLRSLPSLALVNIYNSNNEHDYYDSLVNLLAHDDQFLPALCSLALHSFYVIPTLPLPLKEMVEMVEMVASRWNGKRAGVSKLESFHLAVVRGAQSVKATDKLRMELLPLATEGLQVDIRIN